jgi:hypothetical protein
VHQSSSAETSKAGRDIHYMYPRQGWLVGVEKQRGARWSFRWRGKDRSGSVDETRRTTSHGSLDGTLVNEC